MELFKNLKPLSGKQRVPQKSVGQTIFCPLQRNNLFDLGYGFNVFQIKHQKKTGRLSLFDDVIERQIIRRRQAKSSVVRQGVANIYRPFWRNGNIYFQAFLAATAASIIFRSRAWVWKTLNGLRSFKVWAAGLFILETVEAQRGDNLHSLLDEMRRWRGIIEYDYLAYKQGKTREYLF